MELDSDDEGYFLRRKRRRVTENSEVSSPYVHRRSYRRKNPIMHMPTEILQMIFGYISNEDLASSIRLVNHRFRAIAQSILNFNFKKLKDRMETLKKMIVDSIPHTQDDMETRCMCKMLSTLELLSFYHSVIRSTLWRYVHFQASPSNLCMYAGSILDMYGMVLRQFVTEPQRIYSAAILRDYTLSKEVKAICNNTKAFALYFDRISELPINNNSFCTGSKILDLLDCATDSTRTVVVQKLTKNTLTLKHYLIRSTLWRYVHFQASPSNLCMYAGSILNMYGTVLRQFVTEPQRIYSAAILRDYTLSKEVKAICNNTKAFALYFDRISELPINNNSFCTGSKILDLLDCATDSTRTVRYYFTNAWFVALDIPEEKSKPWNEQQRLMYMRLRRIVVNHSEMTMEYNQYRREMLIRTNPVSRIRRPINSVYTGYGEVGNKFFYYGVMNEGAYFNKFENDQPTNRISFLGLDVSVELKCPLQLAPFAVVEGYKKQDDFQDRPILTPHKKIRGTFDLKVDFECLAARYPRLPTTFNYHLRFQR